MNKGVFQDDPYLLKIEGYFDSQTTHISADNFAARPARWGSPVFCVDLATYKYPAMRRRLPSTRAKRYRHKRTAAFCLGGIGARRCADPEILQIGFYKSSKVFTDMLQKIADFFTSAE